VVGLANDLGIVSTAEGVESEQQLETLRGIGCMEMQGFIFSQPKPLAQIVRLFPERKARAVSAA
jgi:EAL domain-containing protein (putative c-di-GMP-specific phosphodiesterase class I)